MANAHASRTMFSEHNESTRLPTSDEMDLRQLRYFVALATQQHYGRAAGVLHVTQPALSRQIRLLEEELGVELFKRHARGAAPTEEANLLLERAMFLLRYAEQIKSDLQARQRDPRGPVAVGLSPGLAQQLTVVLTQAVLERFPEVRLRIVEGFAPSLQAMLTEGKVDIALLIEPVERSPLSTVSLLKEQICLIGKPEDARVRKARIRIRDLARVPLVMTGLVKSGVRLELEAAAARAKIELNHVVEVETVEVARRLVMNGVGLTAHFAAAVQEDIEAGRLRAVPIEGLFLHRVIARASNRPASRATEGVMDVIRMVVERHVRAGKWPNAELT
jgi:LysR family transcriptional regulator, nitrogen assimilation regulatory protein